ncbi:hypothetical protein GCM10022377_00560 [Zhihengliuella alba]|uniref:Uncharacterized protein n=1 Tax=Zhihengliuella alba TaxID=547018 RepID=A0ABP7CM58_9MICC
MTSDPVDPQPSRQVRAGLRTPQVLTVVAVVAAEALLMLGLAVASLVEITSPGIVGVPGRVFLLAMMLGAGAWQGWVAWKYLTGKAWTRAAIVAWQVFQIILAVPMLDPGNGSTTALTGWALLVPAAVALLCLFSRSSTEHLAATEARR